MFNKEEINIDWNKKMMELEQRLASVEHELKQLKHTAQQPEQTRRQHGQAEQQRPPQSNANAYAPPHGPASNQHSNQHSNRPNQGSYAGMPAQQPTPYPTQQPAYMANQAQSLAFPANQVQHQQSQWDNRNVPPFQQPLQQSQWDNRNAPPFQMPPQQLAAGALQAKDASSMESILVKYVLPIVFIIILLVGILLLFIAGVAYGLITEPVRCLLGAFLAACMYIVGLMQQRHKRPIWGKVLLGGAHGTFIITVSVAHLAYELIGVILAALLYAAAFGLIIFSAVRWRSQLLVTIAVISGYLCMFLIDFDSIHTISFIIIQLVFSISMMLLAAKLNYRYAYGFAYMLLHVSLLITNGLQEYFSYKYLLAALIVQHLVVFVQYMRRQLVYTEHVVAQFIGIIAIISWSAYYYNNPGGTSLIYLAVTLIIAVAYALALLYFERALSQEEVAQDLKRSLMLRTEISAIITSIALLFFFIELIGASFIGLVLFLLGTSLVLYGLRDEHPVLRWFGACLVFFGAISIIFDAPSKLASYEVLSWIIMLISIPVVYRECRHTFTGEKAQPNLLAGILWTEAALIFIFMAILANLLGDVIGNNVSTAYLVSMSWLLYAIAAIIVGAARKLKKARLTGIILLLVIVIKVIFIDITFLNLLSKSIMFTVLGGVGIVVSFFLYNRTDEKKEG